MRLKLGKSKNLGVSLAFVALSLVGGTVSAWAGAPTGVGANGCCIGNDCSFCEGPRGPRGPRGPEGPRGPQGPAGGVDFGGCSWVVTLGRQSVTASCGSGRFAVSGGCHWDTGSARDNLPAGVVNGSGATAATGWTCTTTANDPDNIVAYALCCTEATMSAQGGGTQSFE